MHSYIMGSKFIYRSLGKSLQIPSSSLYAQNSALALQTGAMLFSFPQNISS